jgi:proline dehydrogenase
VTDGSGEGTAGPRRPRALLRGALQAFVARVSRNYIAGPSLSDARRISEELARRGYWLTLGYWDSAKDAPGTILDTYLASLDALAGFAGHNYLSVKIPALRYDPAGFSTLLTRSQERRVPLMFDALESDQAEPTLEFIARETDPSRSEVGVVLPGRWLRSLSDAERAISLGLVVRVVKGQSPDPRDPNRDPTEGYLEVVRALAGRAKCVRVASHNPIVAGESLRILTAAGTPCELELLYGLPVGTQVKLAVALGVPVRVYVAFGHAFLPYALASMRRHPGAMLRLLREALRGDCLSTFPVVPPRSLPRRRASAAGQVTGTGTAQEDRG